MSHKAAGCLPWAIERILRYCRRLGLYSHRSLAEQLIYGGGIHYAGTLPMRRNSKERYESDAAGVLSGDRDVLIVDGAVLPYPPSKNHTLTIMANAMRVCDQLCNREQTNKASE